MYHINGEDEEEKRTSFSNQELVEFEKGSITTINDEP
jgi:hypothetical protein